MWFFIQIVTWSSESCEKVWCFTRDWRLVGKGYLRRRVPTFVLETTYKITKWLYKERIEQLAYEENSVLIYVIPITYLCKHILLCAEFNFESSVYENFVSHQRVNVRLATSTLTIVRFCWRTFIGLTFLKLTRETYFLITPKINRWEDNLLIIW